MAATDRERTGESTVPARMGPEATELEVMGPEVTGWAAMEWVLASGRALRLESDPGLIPVSALELLLELAPGPGPMVRTDLRDLERIRGQ